VPVKLAGPGSAARRRSGWWLVVVAWWGLFATWAADSGRRDTDGYSSAASNQRCCRSAGVTFAACDNLGFKLS
jgi:hypothetical protein